jgi:hypothetical protein
MHLLRKAGVDADWTWDQTMRTIITDPLYKALNSLAEKKATWQKVRFPCSQYNILLNCRNMRSTQMVCVRRKKKSVKHDFRSSAQLYVTCSRAIRACFITLRSLLRINYSRSIPYGNKLVSRLSESSYSRSMSQS